MLWRAEFFFGHLPGCPRGSGVARRVEIEWYDDRQLTTLTGASSSSDASDVGPMEAFELRRLTVHPQSAAIDCILSPEIRARFSLPANNHVEVVQEGACTGCREVSLRSAHDEHVHAFSLSKVA